MQPLKIISGQTPLISFMNKIPVIIDCDPGADDALGILLALNSPQLEILGITVVCGNGPSEQMAKNAARICALARRSDIQIYQGARQPLFRSLAFTPLYCGKDGLCNTGLKEHNEFISSKTAQEFLLETLTGSQLRPVTVIATAGFTNLAAAILKKPSVIGGIREIAAASGYFGLNPEPNRAEWNIMVDPEAADVVYHSGAPVKAVGLDVSAGLKDSFVEQLLAEGRGAVYDFLLHCTHYNRQAGLAAYSLLVDAMAVAAVIEPGLAEYVTGKAAVDPRRQDGGLMEFTPQKTGMIQAAVRFDYEAYLKLLRGLLSGG